jgi:ribosomal protein L29
MTVDQLDDELLKLKKEQFNLRFQRRAVSSRTRRACARCAATSRASDDRR